MSDNLDEIIEQRAKAKVEQDKAQAETPKNEIVEHSENATLPTVEMPLPEMKVEIDKSKSYTEQAKDFVGVVATQKAIEDEELAKKLTEIKKDELLESANADLKEEKAKSSQADTNLQKANYGTFEGVATYAGIKKPLPLGMQKVLFGILAFFQTILLILIGFPTSLITIVADCINVIVEKLSNIAKSARVLVVSLLVLGVVALVGWVAISILKNFGIIA